MSMLMILAMGTGTQAEGGSELMLAHREETCKRRPQKNLGEAGWASLTLKNLSNSISPLMLLDGSHYSMEVSLDTASPQPKSAAQGICVRDALGKCLGCSRVPPFIQSRQAEQGEGC